MSYYSGLGLVGGRLGERLLFVVGLFGLLWLCLMLSLLCCVFVVTDCCVCLLVMMLVFVFVWVWEFVCCLVVVLGCLVDVLFGLLYCGCGWLVCFVCLLGFDFVGYGFYGWWFGVLFVVVAFGSVGC